MSKSILTQERLKQLLSYNADTGVFVWETTTSNRVVIGSCAGTKKRKDGYMCIQLDKRIYLSHKLAWLFVYGEMHNEIDHINRNKSDNRISNLRVCTRSENNQNTGKRSDNTSGIKGVSFVPKTRKWHAYIGVNGKRKNIGYFDSLKEAEKNRRIAENILHPFASAL